MNTTFFVGLDLGKKHDPTAVAVVERIDRARAFQGSEFHRLAVRHVERVPLGTAPYPRVVERVRRIVQSPTLRGRCALAVDATGVGEPVVDLLRDASRMRTLRGHDHGRGVSARQRVSVERAEAGPDCACAGAAGAR